MTGCTSDRCQQGKKPCPCPEACELPVEYAEDEPLSFRLIWWATLFFVVVAAVSFIAGLAAGSN